MTRLRPLRAAALLALAAASALSAGTARAEGCADGGQPYWITGYIRGEGNPTTADGTDIFSEEPIAAAGYDLPLGAYVWVEGIGMLRVADRGLLGPRWLDVAVWSADEAYSLTGWACTWRLA